MIRKRGSTGSCNSKILLPNSKRAQVTIFIIIGIVILFAFAGILYVTKLNVTESFTAAGEPVIADVPQEFKPIRSYTEHCLQEVAARGLRLLGQQGGYIYPDVVGRYSTTDPTESDGINLDPAKVPYWYYNVEPNAAYKVTFSSLQPKLHSKDDPQMSIESQLARFVDENIENCLSDYTPFTQSGFQIQQREGQTEVQVTPGTVNFLLSKPVTVQRAEAQATMDTFFVKIPLDLNHLYEVASQITNAQRDSSYLERQGMELIAIYSRKDAAALPPTSDVGYQLYSVLSWDEFTVKQKIKQLLTSYVPLLRYLGSSNFYYSTFPEGNRLAQNVIDNMVLPLSGAEDLAVRFDYLGWEPYLKTNSDGGTIKPDHLFVNYYVLNFGTQRYETHYDISYPVLITLSDSTAFNGEGYNLVFGLESNIRNNAPAVGGNILAPALRKISSLACNKEQRNTELLKTVVVDSFTGDPIENVKFGFTIPGQEDCEIGLTDQSGIVESRYPAVYGGVINLIHPEYLTNFYPINTYKYRENKALLGYAVANVDAAEKVVEMDKIKTINVKIQKKEFKKSLEPLSCKYKYSVINPPFLVPYKDISCELGSEQKFFNAGDTLFPVGDPAIQFKPESSLSGRSNYYFIDQAKDLSDDEEAFITLERVGGFHNEIVNDDFTTIVSVKGKETMEVQLVPGIYKVNGIVTLNTEIKIPEEGRCFRYSISTWDKEECFTLDEQKMSQYISGNLNWNSTATYLTITSDKLYPASTLTLYLPSQDLLSVPEKTDTTMNTCDSYTCVPKVGCLFDICDEEDVLVSSRVVEDMQVPGKLAEITQQPEIRSALEPTYE